MKTQSEIDAVAAMVRGAGCPDTLNRWLGMTPEKLAEEEALIARHSADDRNRRRTEMPRQTGKKEQQLRDMREGKGTDQAPADTAPVAKKKAAKTAAKPKEKAAPAVLEQETRASAVRPGSKMETIKKMLARKKGCTSAEIKEACEWPSVSMPQQAKALGVTLHKHKGEDGVTRYADHPLTTEQQAS